MRLEDGKLDDSSSYKSMDSRRVRLNSDYDTEMLRYLLSLAKVTVTQTTGAAGDFLSRDPEIHPRMRDRLAQWVCDLAAECHLSSHTTHLALVLINELLARLGANKAVLQLVGVVALMLATKFEETQQFSLEQAFEQGAGQYSKEQIVLTEVYALEKLEWRLSFPTGAELARQLIYVTGVDYDFSKVMEQSDAFASMCYLDYRLSLFSPVTIAVVSVSCALDQFRQTSFRNQWLALLHYKLDIDLREVDLCRRLLLHQLHSQASETERAKLPNPSDSLLAALGLGAGKANPQSPCARV